MFNFLPRKSCLLWDCLWEKNNNAFFVALITRKHYNITFYVHCVLCNNILKSKLGINKSWICSLHRFLHDVLNITIILLLESVHGWSRPNRSDCISIQGRFYLIHLQTLGIFPILEMHNRHAAIVQYHRSDGIAHLLVLFQFIFTNRFIIWRYSVGSA